MKITSLKSIYLTEKELKQAIANWIKSKHGNSEIVDHLVNGSCEMDWTQEGLEFIVSLDNEFIEDETEIHLEEPSSAKIEVREVGYAFEGNELED